MQVFVAGQIGWTGENKWEAKDFAGQFRQTLKNTLAVLAEAGGRPEQMDLTDWDAWQREYNDLLGLSHKVTNDEKQVAILRAARAKAQQAQQQQSAATHTLPAVAGAIKDVGGIDVGGGINAAQLMLGGGNAAPGPVQ